MQKRAFQALKRTFLHVSGLPPPFLDKKNYKVIGFYKTMVWEDLRHAKTCVSGPETHVYACLRSSPPYFEKKTASKVIGFLIKTW